MFGTSQNAHPRLMKVVINVQLVSVDNVVYRNDLTETVGSG